MSDDGKITVVEVEEKKTDELTDEERRHHFKSELAEYTLSLLGGVLLTISGLWYGSTEESGYVVSNGELVYNSTSEIVFGTVFLLGAGAWVLYYSYNRRKDLIKFVEQMQ